MRNLLTQPNFQVEISKFYICTSCFLQVPPIFGLDTSDVTKWAESVSELAEKIVQCYMSSTDCPIGPLPMEQIQSTPANEDTTYRCDVCNRIFVGTFQWKMHLRSRKHKKVHNKQKEKVLGK